MAKVLVVDDTAVDRTLIEGILADDPQINVVVAASGREALTTIDTDNQDVDLVITDLTMPEMDGLQLVTEMRVRRPDVPVILTTAHSSEHLAAGALEQGAASYVPKSRLAADLRDTVDRVLALASAERSYHDLVRSMTEAQFKFRLEGGPRLFDRAVEFVQQIVSSMGVCDTREEVRLGMALEEALLCAYFRGNLELSHEQIQNLRSYRDEHDPLLEERQSSSPYGDRSIFFEANITPATARFVVRHEGPGIDIGSCPRADDPSAFQDAAYRDLILMQMLMDEVSFDKSGAVVTMIKNRSDKPALVAEER